MNPNMAVGRRISSVLYLVLLCLSLLIFYSFLNKQELHHHSKQQTQLYHLRWSSIRRKCFVLGSLKGERISYYSNSTATYRTRLMLLFDIEVNPGPDQSSTRQRKLKCLYLNSRSLVNKAKYLEAMES